MPHPLHRGLLITSLAGTPLVLARLTHGLGADALDRRPDPNRFTVREILAHLADWDPIFRERMRVCRDERSATFVPRDEEQMAIDNDYAHSDAAASLTRFTQERAVTVSFLRDLSAEQWDLAAAHVMAGPMTIGNLVDLVAAHDGYHVRQIAEWLR